MEKTPHKTMTFRLSIELYNSLKEESIKEFRTANATIELALRKYLAEKAGEEKSA